MLCRVNMKNEINVSMDLTFQAEQVTGSRITESNYMKEANVSATTMECLLTF